MKLAIFTPGFAPVPAVNGGAIEQLIENIINENEVLHKFDIDLYTIDDPKLANQNYKYTNLIKVDISNLWIRFIHKLKNSYMKIVGINRYSLAVDEMVHTFKKNYYDVVLVENNMDLFRKLFDKKITTEKLYFHLHNDFDCDDPAKTKSKTEFVINHADKVIVVSKFLQNKLRNYGCNKAKILPNLVVNTWFNQLSPNQCNQVRDKYNIQKEDIVFTYVGRLSEEKGVDKLLIALKNVKRISNLHIKLLIVGSNFFRNRDGKLFIEKLQSISSSFKDDIVFTGKIDNKEISKIYSISNCVVIPSQCEEAFGIVALEAMTMKKPVIASKSGALPEVLDPKGSIIIPRDSRYIANLTRAIINIASNKLLRKKMGANNYEKRKAYPCTEAEYYKEMCMLLNEK